MIATVTLNVAIDKAYVIEKLEQGTVMRVKRCTNTPGGKGLNVAKVAKLCGEEVLATGFAGGFNGKSVISMLNECNVPNNFVEVKNETRCCINILSEDDNSSTEFLEPGAPVDEAEVERFLTVFEDILKTADVITISGSAPKGVDTGIYGKLIELCHKNNVPVCLDTSGKLLEDGIKALPTLIKPNTDEISALLNVSVNNEDDVMAGAVKLFEMGIPYVVISLGSKGALLVCGKGIYRGMPPKIVPVNTVGCGDSMLAAFAVGIRKGLEPEEMMREAVAVSAANALSMATGHFERADYESILPGVVVEKIK